MNVVRLPMNYERATPVERKVAREAYIQKQMGNCYFCEHPLTEEPPAKLTELEIDWTRFPEYFMAHPIHLQHNHKTGMTEGAVHAFCNAFLFDYLGR